ncbi:MAG: MucB/RseB C-terminal domain-containing protein [Gammaproteobacteria bacterium]
MNRIALPSVNATALSVLMCALAVPALAAETAREWFDRMGKAVETLDYQGTMVHAHNNQLDTLEVVHQLRKGRVYERVTSLNGSGREVIRHGDDVRCTYTDRKQVLVDWGNEQSPLQSVLPAYDESLEKLYRFELRANAGRVAGRPVHEVNVRPLDAYRYGYRLRLDAETAMPLFCELIGDDNQVIESVMFTEIDFAADVPDDAFEPKLSTTNFEEVSAKSASGDVVDNQQARWLASDVPEGFSLSLVTRHGNDENGTEHLVYTDGVASISVFVERHRANVSVIEGIANIGAANAYGRRLDAHHVTVVGEVPTATVELIGKSVRMNQ